MPHLSIPIHTSIYTWTGGNKVLMKQGTSTCPPYHHCRSWYRQNRHGRLGDCSIGAFFSKRYNKSSKEEDSSETGPPTVLLLAATVKKLAKYVKAIQYSDVSTFRPGTTKTLFPCFLSFFVSICQNRLLCSLAYKTRYSSSKFTYYIQ